jgi:exopolyphosphatase / guanosine-5'-triphosphate,3'-diphosphate pyrophosphatase
MVCGEGVRTSPRRDIFMADGTGPLPAQDARGGRPGSRRRTLYAALDLGTNNCRLLVAEPARRGFRIVDAFSRIVRLGEGLSRTGALSEAAQARALDALAVCADKIDRRKVDRVRCIATQACRVASNGSDFLRAVRDRTGLRLDVITPREEARLAVAGCAQLIDPDAQAALVVDIGGGSTELSWLAGGGPRWSARHIDAWTSLPFGVVTLAEQFPEPESGDLAVWYRSMVEAVQAEVAAVGHAQHLAPHFTDGAAHIVGTSGAVTSLAGVHLGLARYSRAEVDGLWITQRDVTDAIRKLAGKSRAARAAEPCIGPDRADLVLAGAAILEAILAEWPSEHVRVADRGLREGVLLSMMQRRRSGGR